MVGEINSFTINTEIINGPGIIGHTGVGNMVAVDQNVGVLGEGTLISIEQVINHHVTGSGDMIAIEQDITNTGVGTMIAIEQVIRDQTVKDHLSLYGWDVIIKIDGTRIPNDTILDTIKITRTENSTALLSFTTRPAAGAINLTQFQGKKVTVDIIEPTKTTRAFTGNVDIPLFDTLSEKITYECSAQRIDLINAEYTTKKNSLGHYSTDLFTEAEDVYEEVQQRLSTTPFALDFDAFNVDHLTSWVPKSTADFVLTGGDLYSKDLPPNLRLVRADQILNQVNAKITYRIPVDFHNQLKVTWESPIFMSPCLLLVDAYSRIQRTTIEEAANVGGWPIKGVIDYEFLPNGTYGCSVGGPPILFSNQSTSVQVVNVQVDSNGDPVLDINGNPVLGVDTRTVTDFSTQFAEQAGWSSTTRWSQTLEEEYSITIKSQQSIDQYTLKEREEQHGIESPYDTTEWEDYTAFSDLGLGIRYTVLQDTNKGDFNNLTTTVLNRAKTAILNSHRQNRVSFKTPILPTVDLRHTVEIDTVRLDCKGKVVSIIHLLNINTTTARTEIQVALSRAEGSSTDDTLSLLARPTYTPNIPSTGLRLGNRFGSEPQPEDNGAHGDAIVSGAFTNFGIGFTVDYPEIPAELRETHTIEAAETFSVSIPQDELSVTYTGKPIT